MKKILSFFAMLWSGLKTGAARTWKYAKGHKVIAGIVLLILIGGSYWGYTAMAAGSKTTQYVLSRVSQDTLNVTVTGSGQVSAQDTLNLTPQASGQITYIGVTPGQSVKAGTLVAQLDMTTAAQAVTTAKQNLKSAQISYQQTLSTSGTTVTNDQTTLATAQTNDLAALSTTYTGLASVMTGLDGVLYDFSTITGYTAQKNIDAYASFVNTAQSHSYHDQVAADFVAATAAYQQAESEYSSSEPSAMTITQIEQLNRDTLAADVAIGKTIKDSLAYYNYINAQLSSAKILIPTQIASQISSLSSYQSTVMSNDSSVTSAQSSLVNAQQSITQDTQSLGDSNVPLNVQSAQINVDKAQEALTEALTNESNYMVRAPFDGEIATVPVNKYDQASSGTTIATLITTEEYADLSLNETDAAKVKVGQPVSITFDAITGLTMPGTVAIVNPVGTVSQGVVTYDVKISFTAQDVRIKPGMTAEAVITTASAADAIQVPSAAIKTNGNSSYVQVATITNVSSTTPAVGAAGQFGSTTVAFRARTASSTSAFPTRSLTLPASQVTIKNVPVTVGVSNDTMTQVLTGLTPGEFVVTATQSASGAKKSTATSATSLLGGATRTTGATGAVRATGGFSGGGNVRVGGGG